MNELETVDPVSPYPVANAAGAVTPMQMLQMAVQKGTDLDQLTKLMDLQERWERNEARKAYQAAFAAFKSEAVVIVKNIDIKDGPLKGKKYADLFAAVDAATPMLSKHGLTAAWKITKDEKDWIEATCTLTHVAGHSESTSFGGPPDAGGAKNAMQARASTLSYLQRYTFLSVTGLAAGGVDNDGSGGGDIGEGVTPERRKEIQESVVSEMKAHMKNGAIGDAVLAMENSDLDGPEEYRFAWSFFDSKERSAMKKANERMKLERKSKPISDAQRQRLEAMISERKVDRESIKAYCLEQYGIEHFKDLTSTQYDSVCAEVEVSIAPSNLPPAATDLPPVSAAQVVEAGDAPAEPNAGLVAARKAVTDAYNMASTGIRGEFDEQLGNVTIAQLPMARALKAAAWIRKQIDTEAAT